MQFRCYPLFIIRFAFTGIMVYIAWDAYANPYHKDRVHVITSKVYFHAIALFYPFRVWQLSYHLSIWLFAGIPRTTRVPVNVHAPPHVGSRGISVRQALSPWHSAGSHPSNCRKFFALHSLFCLIITWWFLFFCRRLSQSRALAWSGHGTRTSHRLRRNWTTSNGLIDRIPI
jgi:hypothetical protein